MEYIALDTNIFVKENFLEGRRLQELFRLSKEEKIKIVLTQITIDEVKKKFREYTKKSLSELGKFRNIYECKVLKNDINTEVIYNRFNKNDIISSFDKRLSDLITEAKVILVDYRALDIKDIFEKYFRNQHPFNTANKKNEFPDAFSIQLLEFWCKKNSRKCIVFSRDKDFLNTPSNYLEATHKYEDYLDKKLRYFIELDKKEAILKNILEKNSSEIDKEIEEWYKGNLDDYELYYQVIYLEIYDIQIEVEIGEKTYQIISIDDEYIEIELSVEVTYIASITTDDEDYYIYDSDDKTTYYMETKEERIQRDDIAKAIIVFSITSEDEYEDWVDIISVNEDKKLVINPDTDY